MLLSQVQRLPLHGHRLSPAQNHCAADAQKPSDPRRSQLHPDCAPFSEKNTPLLQKGLTCTQICEQKKCVSFQEFPTGDRYYPEGECKLYKCPPRFMGTGWSCCCTGLEMLKLCLWQILGVQRFHPIVNHSVRTTAKVWKRLARAVRGCAPAAKVVKVMLSGRKAVKCFPRVSASSTSAGPNSVTF